MYELSEFFSGNRPLARGVQRNDNYVSWFSEMSKQIDGLDFEETGIASRKI